MDVTPVDILKPVSSQNPCGEDMSFSPEFDFIQEARREDDSTVDYGEWKTTLKEADWKSVVAKCTELLETRTKDLRVCAWLTEGLTKTCGFAGLASGIVTTARMMENFGQDIHPLAEDGDQEQRMGSLIWFVTRLSQLVGQIPITASVAGSFGLNDYEAARLLQMQLQRHSESTIASEQRVTLEKFSAAAEKTDKAKYVGWIADLESCIAGLNQLSTVSDTFFGLDSPSFSPLTKTLDAVLMRVQSIAKERGVSAVTEKARTEEGKNMNEATAANSSDASGPIKNRAQALAKLREVAEFFRETEPHSPVAYLAEKAAQWGAMPLHTWLRNVVKDRGTLSNIEELLGIEMDDDAR